MAMSEMKSCSGLNSDEISRYSRQIFVNELGVAGQQKLKLSNVLVVGCGGLGCPASQYLVAAGVGHVGLVDYDDVELSNLHRQVLHSEKSIGTAKVKSLAEALRRLNSNVKIDEHNILLSNTNCLELVVTYDIVVDATDNAPTRYLLNDACFLAGRPLVSAAAVKTEGQLTVYNYDNGPCYRCLFPEPPPPQTVSRCGDVGVLPFVPGVLGVLQAQQVFSIILGLKDAVLSGRMILMDLTSTKFSTIYLRPKSPVCKLCGPNPTVTKLLDYELFCSSSASDKDSGINLLKEGERITAEKLADVLKRRPEGLMVVDVRSEVEYEMCNIPGTTNVPLDRLLAGCDLEQQLRQARPSTVYVICRRGNDSQRAVVYLRNALDRHNFMDVVGGLHSWARLVDSSFPIY